MLIKRWTNIFPNCTRRKGCVIGLPGRGVPFDTMELFLSHMELDESVISVLEPNELAWYPQPNGADDQKDSITGMKYNLLELEHYICKIQRTFRLKRSKIAIVGYSAGAVMALQLASRSKHPFAAVVSMAGAILDPTELPEAPSQTPILIRHAVDDDCFSWDERYLPMKQALHDKNYNLFYSEKANGGHGIQREDAVVIGKFLTKNLNYKNFFRFRSDTDEE